MCQTVPATVHDLHSFKVKAILYIYFTLQNIKHNMKNTTPHKQKEEKGRRKKSKDYSIRQKDAYFIRCRAEALHSGLFLHFLETQVSPSFFLSLAPFLASSLLPAQEDVIFLLDTNQKKSAKGETVLNCKTN